MIKAVSISALTLLSIVVWFGCSKESDPLDPVPSIKLLTVSPTQVVEYQDSIVFTIEYSDGDGDLGENDANVKNLFLTDLRNDVTYEYRIQQLAPDNANIPIQGQLDVKLPHTAILGSNGTETVKYQIYVTDRSGNTSNTITTGDITITR